MPPDDHLRLGEKYQPWQPTTYFRFPEDGGSMSRATLRCVGVGKCRRAEEAFMCPSFLATREEQHTTRGRAHILFEMLRGDFIKDGWQSEEVKETLDVCLGCKGCKKECPVQVDIETWKAEFQAHYYAHKMRPRHHYFFGMLDRLGAAGATVPQLTNFVAGAPLLSSVAKEITGVHQDRPLPRFADETFISWFNNHRPTHKNGREVVLYPDAFNNFFYPRALKSIVRLLERWGFTVIVPAEHPAIRPLVHFGMLDRALDELHGVIDSLAPYVRRGVDVVIAEPSTASIFKDEMGKLLPNDRDAQRLTDHVFLFSEFINEKDLSLPKMQGKVVFHGHCHQKAVLNVTAARQVLDTMGLDFTEPQEGCCGMAGAFGFEKAHYPLSIRIGETHLLPAVRAAGLTTWIVADGFSCRTQIKDGTDREALHLAELIEQGFHLNHKGLTTMKQQKAVPTSPGYCPVVVITGASAGLGRATARAFAREGAKICLIARGRERLEEARQEVQHLGGQAFVIEGDVADPAVLERAADETEKNYGRIDYWVNNAMATIFAEFSDITAEEFRRVTEVTYLAASTAPWRP